MGRVRPSCRGHLSNLVAASRSSPRVAFAAGGSQQASSQLELSTPACWSGLLGDASGYTCVNSACTGCIHTHFRFDTYREDVDIPSYNRFNQRVTSIPIIREIERTGSAGSFLALSLVHYFSDLSDGHIIHSSFAAHALTLIPQSARQRTSSRLSSQSTPHPQALSGTTTTIADDQHHKLQALMTKYAAAGWPRGRIANSTSSQLVAMSPVPLLQFCADHTKIQTLRPAECNFRTQREQTEGSNGGGM